MLFAHAWTFVPLALAPPVSGLPALGGKASSLLASTKSRPAVAHDEADGLAVRGAGKRWPSILGRQNFEDTWMVLVNASPYAWRRGYIHQYQMAEWLDDCPGHILPGETVSVRIQPTKGAFNWGDSAAEVEYHLVGTSEPMSFMAKFSNRHPPSLRVEFRGRLSSLNNANGSEHDLGVNEFPGGSAFILAGREGDFITNDPPIGWMQAMLPELAHVPLREILLPRSHHAGMWKNVKRVGFGQPANSQTQSVHLRHQLGDGGIRVLDFRPVRTKGDFRESHGSHVLGLYHGVLGASLSEMIGFVNEFNRRHPGELVVWDVNGDQAWNGRRRFRELDQQDREALYAQFMSLEHRVSFPDEDADVSLWPLGRFIGNKTSAVIVNFDESWRRLDGEKFPGGRHGFVTGKNFPLTHQWTNTDSLHHLVHDQVRRFHEVRGVPGSPIHIADWVVTQQGIRAALPSRSILQLAAPVWRSLFEDLWRESSGKSYPNWVTVDNVRGNQFKALVMAMNHCLVAKRCGDLGGKVRAGGG
ncbi:hypothetical protein Trco_002939 [Trichoderma cornu-damae]|uniref:PLC-like phosphodiesterase n=1 Tax=Trichoderma cornu-damae TaxID=654480 RepID=A0A9P8TYH2_9HYPO|nr:hypothetical protein Trco_002939 [Trichoderma cornu-damae]